MSGVEYLGSITCRNQAVAKKQLIGKELLFATEDWLATKKNLHILRFGHLAHYLTNKHSTKALFRCLL